MAVYRILPSSSLPRLSDENLSNTPLIWRGDFVEPERLPTEESLEGIPLTQIPRGELEKIFSTKEISEVLKYIKEKLKIKIVNYDEVVDYLRRFPDILHLLQDICTATRERFPTAELLLDTTADPEIDLQDLTIYVRYSEYNEETLRDLTEGIDEVTQRFNDAFKHQKGMILIYDDLQPATKIE